MSKPHKIHHGLVQISEAHPVNCAKLGDGEPGQNL